MEPLTLRRKPHLMKLIKETAEDKEGNQMSLISDTSEVIKFLEFVGQQSILNEHTVNCRLTACNNLFSILHDGEDNVEYLLQNLELLIHRFRNKNTSVQASTLKVYKSRVKSSLEDYRAWSKDPIAWEKSVNDKSKLSQQKERKPRNNLVANQKKVAAQSTAPENAGEQSPQQRDGRRVCFPIRPDANVEVVLPAEGLTLKELLRLGLFLYPYCKDLEQRDDQGVGVHFPM
jgi:hypothetical protein